MPSSVFPFTPLQRSVPDGEKQSRIFKIIPTLHSFNSLEDNS